MSAADRPNVLFLLSDQHNHRLFDHVTEPVDEPVATPRLSALAARSANFERTYCQSPICTPSRICMLTGRSVPASGGWANHSRLRPGLPTLPGQFSEAGYETCLVGKMHLGGDCQFAGFDRRPYGDITGTSGHQFEPLFESPPDFNPRKGAGKEYASGYAEPGALRAILAEAGVTEIPESLHQEYNVVRETLSYLREHRHRRPDEPWFLCASLSRPHPPYTAPRRHVERYWPAGVPEPPVGHEGDAADHPRDADDHPLVQFTRELFDLDAAEEGTLARARAAYFACVTYLDEIVADALAALERVGFLEDTVVIYASDHGEMAGEHGVWGKSVWHESSTRVPWLVQLPGHRAGEREPATVTTPVSLADLFPTLCGLCDVPAPENLDGVDLSESVRTGAEPDRGPVVCDFFGPDRERTYRMVREGRYKHVRFADGEELLFDLAEDPFETTDLAPGGDEDTDIDEEARRLVGFAERSVDFEAALDCRARDERRDREHQLEIPRGHGNAYLMPDGRLVDADTPLYRPYVLATDLSKVLADWPGE